MVTVFITIDEALSPRDLLFANFVKSGHLYQVLSSCVAVLILAHLSTCVGDVGKLVDGAGSMERSPAALISVVAGCALLVLGFAILLKRIVVPAIQTLLHQSTSQLLSRRGTRRSFCRDLKSAALISLGVASVALVLHHSVSPPLELTFPVLSQKWGPVPQSSANERPGWVEQARLQLWRTSVAISESTLLQQVSAVAEVHSTAQRWQPDFLSTAAAAATAAAEQPFVATASSIYKEPLTHTVQDFRGDQTGPLVEEIPIAAGAIKSSTTFPDKVDPVSGADVVDKLSATAKLQSSNDFLGFWLCWANGQSMQQWQPESVAALTPAAVAVESTLPVAPSPPKTVAVMKTDAKTVLPAKSCASSSADFLTLWAFWANEQTMQQWQPLSSAITVPAPDTDTKHDVSASVPSPKEPYSPFAPVTSTAIVVSGNGSEAPTTASSLTAICATARPAPPDCLPPTQPELTVVSSHVESHAGGRYHAVHTFFMETWLGHLLLAVIMLALDGIVIPGVSFWWEFGIFNVFQYGAHLAPITPSDPMTLKMKNAGVDAGQHIKRTSSRIKARVSRDLPGMPSLQALHHALTGADSILAKLMRLSSSSVTDGATGDDEAAAQSPTQSAAQPAAQSEREQGGAPPEQPRADPHPRQAHLQPHHEQAQPRAQLLEAPLSEAPLLEALQSEAPLYEAPLPEAPLPEASQSEAPQSEAPLPEAPLPEAPPAALLPLTDDCVRPAPVEQMSVMMCEALPASSATVLEVQVAAGSANPTASVVEQSMKLHARKPESKRAKLKRTLRKLFCLPASPSATLE